MNWSVVAVFPRENVLREGVRRIVESGRDDGELQLEAIGAEERAGIERGLADVARGRVYLPTKYSRSCVSGTKTRCENQLFGGSARQSGRHFRLDRD